MEAIQGIDLKRVDEAATKGFTKSAEARVTDYLRGKLIQLHNQQCKVKRLRDEADIAEASQLKMAEQIAAIRAGDWSVIEPFELSDKGGDQKKDDAAK